MLVDRQGDRRGCPRHPTLHPIPSIRSSAFIRGQTSVYGQIERVGGATEKHCGLRVHNQKSRMIICRVDSHELARRLGQFIYEDVLVHGTAWWYRHNWKIARMDIAGVDAPKKGSIKDALRAIHDAGGSAWDRVQDPDALIKEMRGT